MTVSRSRTSIGASYQIPLPQKTLGHATPQLRAHLDAAMGLGASRQQIVEMILRVLFYAGGAAVANVLTIAAEAFRAHGS